MKKNDDRAKQSRSIGCLMLTALFWGTGFVAQRTGMDYNGPMTFLFFRSCIATVLLVALALVTGKIEKKKPELEENKTAMQKQSGVGYTIMAGVICGLCMSGGAILQQVGLQYTTVGKAGFMTSLYIVLVPVFGMLIGKRTHWSIWISVAIAICGLYMLCVTESLTFATTDLYILVCAIFWAWQIITVGHFAPKVNGIWLSALQFATTAASSGIMMFLLETPTLENLKLGWFPIVYAGVFVSGGGFTLQIIGQKHVSSSLSALILSTESVVSVLAGWLILHQVLSAREAIGCVLMFVAVINAQLDIVGLIVKAVKKPAK